MMTRVKNTETNQNETTMEQIEELQTTPQQNNKLLTAALRFSTEHHRLVVQHAAVCWNEIENSESQEVNPD